MGATIPLPHCRSLNGRHPSYIYSSLALQRPRQVDSTHRIPFGRAPKTISQGEHHVFTPRESCPGYGRQS